MGQDRKYGRVMVETSSTGEQNPFAEGEPVFLLRAQDKAAFATVAAYYGLALALGAEEEHLDGVKQVMDDFRRWHETHETKVPD